MGAVPWLHQEMERRMASRLALFKRPPQEVLCWWDAMGGHAALANTLPEAHLMLAHPSSIKAPPTPDADAGWRRIMPRRWRAGPATDTPSWLDESAVPEGSVDLVWANAVLHHVGDRQSCMQRWHAALRTEGFVMFSTLGPDTLRELRALYRDLAWGPCSATLADMHDLGDELVGAGFADPVMDQERVTLTWSTAEQALEELRGLGGNVARGRHAGLRTRAWRGRLVQAMDGLKGPDGRIAMSFELVYGHAFKPTPRHAVTLDAVEATLPSRRRARP